MEMIMEKEKLPKGLSRIINLEDLTTIFTPDEIETRKRLIRERWEKKTLENHNAKELELAKKQELKDKGWDSSAIGQKLRIIGEIVPDEAPEELEEEAKEVLEKVIEPEIAVIIEPEEPEPEPIPLVNHEKEVLKEDLADALNAEEAARTELERLKIDQQLQKEKYQKELEDLKKAVEALKTVKEGE